MREDLPLLIGWDGVGAQAHREKAGELSLERKIEVARARHIRADDAA